MPRNTIGRLHKRPVRPTFIRHWREFRALSQEALAEKVGITKATLSRIETGKQPYSQRIIEAIAEELQCTAIDLIGHAPDQDGPWELWDILDAAQRRQAMRLMRALIETDAA